MIEYKQWDAYWNNFNNWDEALLSDSNRPRDEFWFRIKPWIQTEQQDWRTSNKNIDFRQAVFSGLMVIPAWDQYLTTFKEKYSDSDLSFVDSFTPCNPSSNKHDASWWEENLNIQRRWDPWAAVNKDWNVQFYKSGSYIIQAVCQFIYPDWYDTWDSYLVKEYVRLAKYDKKKGYFDYQNINQSRWCWTDDTVTITHITWCDVWDLYNLYVQHTYWLNVMCRTALNVYRLS